MNSLDDFPCAASIAHSHTDGWWKLVLVGSKGGAHMPAPSVDTYGHRDQHTCTYWEWEYVCVCVWQYVFIGAHWTEDDLLIGDSMVHIDQETCSVGLSLSVLQKTLGFLPPPFTSSAGALCSWSRALYTHCIKPGCGASSPASLPHECLLYCYILYTDCDSWQVIQSQWLTITKGGRVCWFCCWASFRWRWSLKHLQLSQLFYWKLWLHCCHQVKCKYSDYNVYLIRHVVNLHQQSSQIV